MLKTTASLILGALTLLAGSAQAAGPELGGDPAAPLSAEGMMWGGFGAPLPPAGAPGVRTSDFRGRFRAGLILEDVREDLFLTLNLANTLNIGPLRVGVVVPLRLRVADRQPANHALFRMEDFDDARDILRMIRFLEVDLGGKAWSFRGRIGTLEGTSLGHGTSLAGYYNNLILDHPKTGVTLRVGTPMGGGELLLDDVIAPTLVGARLFLQPGAWFSRSSWARNLVVGLSYVADLKAPLAGADESGKSAHLGIVGVDLEYPILRTGQIDIVPYMDLNAILDERTGIGFHAGVFVNVKLPSAFGPRLLTRLEYRRLGAGYVPRYIDSMYDVHRTVFPVGSRSSTKLTWLREGGGAAHGWLGELFFDFGGWVRVGGSYEDAEGPNNSALTLSLILPKWDRVKAGAYYTHRGFDKASEALSLDGATLLAFVSAKLWGPLYGTASYSRTWKCEAGDTLVSEEDWNLGLSVNVTY